MSWALGRWLKLCWEHQPGLCLQGPEGGAASQRGDASLHGAGGDVLEHPHVPVAEDVWVLTAGSGPLGGSLGTDCLLML